MARLQRAKATLDEMITVAATKLGKDPQKILQGLDRDGRSADSSTAIVRRVQGLQVLLKKLL